LDNNSFNLFLAMKKTVFKEIAEEKLPKYELEAKCVGF
jgi:hypothetical protein